MAREIISGSTSNKLRFVIDRAGLTHTTSGLRISTITDNEATPTVYAVDDSNVEDIPLLGTYAAPTAGKCRFKAVDSVNHPKLYELQLANSRLAVTNAKSMVITISGGGVSVPVHYELELMPGISGLRSVAVPDPVTVGVNNDKTSYSLAAGTISADTFTPGAINASVIANNAIDSATFAQGAITADVIASNAIGSTTFTAGAITASVFASNAITSNTFAPGAINAAVIANNAIDSATFSTGAITTNTFAPGAITSSTFAANAINSTVLSTDALGSLELATTAASEIATSVVSAMPSVTGPGAIAKTITLTNGVNPLAGVSVWVSSNSTGSNVIAGTLITDASGQVTFMLAPGTYYVWCQLPGFNFTNPSTITVS